PASRIFLDRMLFDSASGLYDTQAEHCIYANGSYISVTDSYCDHTWVRNDTGAQSNDFLSYNGPGPYKVVNNYTGGATSQKIFFGGGNPDDPNSMADAEVRRNVLTNDLTVTGTPGHILGSNANVASLYELKCCLVRSLFDGNTLDGVLNSAPYYTQNAPAINIKEDQDNTTMFQTADVTVTNNDVRQFSIPIVILGQPQSAATAYPATARLNVQNNLFRGASYNAYQQNSPGGQGASGLFLDSSGTHTVAAPTDLNYQSNSLLAAANNNSGTTYWGEPKGCNTPGSSFPNFNYSLNVVVVDGSFYNGTPQQAYMEGDCSLTMTTLFANGVFPGGSFSANALFNFRISSDTTCANW